MTLRSLWLFWLRGLATIWLYAAVKWVRIRYLVTSQRVIKAIDHYAFLLHVETKEIPLADINGIDVSQNMIGRLLGYTDITIHGDSTTLTLPGLRHPDELRETLRPYL